MTKLPIAVAESGTVTPLPAAQRRRSISIASAGIRYGFTRTPCGPSSSPPGKRAQHAVTRNCNDYQSLEYLLWVSRRIGAPDERAAYALCPCTS